MLSVYCTCTCRLYSGKIHADPLTYTHAELKLLQIAFSVYIAVIITKSRGRHNFLKICLLCKVTIKLNTDVVTCILNCVILQSLFIVLNM